MIILYNSHELKLKPCIGRNNCMSYRTEIARCLVTLSVPPYMTAMEFSEGGL